MTVSIKEIRERINTTEQFSNLSQSLSNSNHRDFMRATVPHPSINPFTPGSSSRIQQMESQIQMQNDGNLMTSLNYKKYPIQIRKEGCQTVQSLTMIATNLMKKNKLN